MTAIAMTGQFSGSRALFLATLMACAFLGGCVSTSGERLYPQVQSFSSLKYAVTVRQAYDFSCGGAAVATLLTHHFGRPTSEVEVLDKLRKRYPGQDWDTLQRNGFSLEDLIWVANQFGFAAQAARVPADDLAQLGGPIIVHVNKGSFEHFTVLRTRHSGRTFLSDPVEGAITLSNEEFDQIYTGSALAIWRKSQKLPSSSRLFRAGPWIDGGDQFRTVGELRLPTSVRQLTR